MSLSDVLSPEAPAEALCPLSEPRPPQETPAILCDPSSCPLPGILHSPASRSPCQGMHSLWGGAEEGPMISAACSFLLCGKEPGLQECSVRAAVTVGSAFLPLSVLSLLPGQEYFPGSWVKLCPGHFSVPSRLSFASFSVLPFSLLSTFEFPSDQALRSKAYLDPCLVTGRSSLPSVDLCYALTVGLSAPWRVPGVPERGVIFSVTEKPLYVCRVFSHVWEDWIYSQQGGHRDVRGPRN